MWILKMSEGLLDVIKSKALFLAKMSKPLIFLPFMLPCITKKPIEFSWRNIFNFISLVHIYNYNYLVFWGDERSYTLLNIIQILAKSTLKQTLDFLIDTNTAWCTNCRPILADLHSYDFIHGLI